MNKLDTLRDERDQTAWTAVLACLDAMAAHLDGGSDTQALRTVAVLSVQAAHAAGARYWRACEEERNNG